MSAGAADRGTPGPGGGRTYGESFADVYELAYHFKDYAADVAYLMAAIRSRHPGPASLLEVAAGTGRYLELFQRDIPDVEGLDLSAPMLERAAARVPAARLHVADMATFDTGRSYDVVCCLFRSIAYCGSAARLHAAIGSMARHLAPGGLLLIEPFFTPDTYRVGDVTMNEARRGDFRLAWMYVAEREGRLGRLRIHYLAGTPAGVRHFEELHELGLFSRADFESAFAAAGLSLEFDAGGPGATGLYIGRRIDR